jgi:protocatechuate 3,4-dioxygenase beta subunit
MLCWFEPDSRRSQEVPMTVVLPARTRRHFLTTLAASGTSLLYAPGVLADQLALTPRQTEGPFYPTKLPLDTDNDLIVVNNGLTPAVGAITHLTGALRDASGAPIRNAIVEIWQVDTHGVYLHPGSDRAGNRDGNFQGFGRFLTGANGEYYFRTVKPVPYPGRTPHIHVKVRRGGKDVLTTQCYIAGEPQNDRDGVLRGIRDERARQSVIVPFAPLPQSTIGELQARFDIVLGLTPEA